MYQHHVVALQLLQLHLTNSETVAVVLCLFILYPFALYS